MLNVRVLVLVAVFVVGGMGVARADWFGMVTEPDHVQLLAEVSDDQQIMPGKPFVAHVTRLDGKVQTTTYVPVGVTVIGDAINVIAQDGTGNRLTLSLIRRPNHHTES